jgi:hypothetical protein
MTSKALVNGALIEVVNIRSTKMLKIFVAPRASSRGDAQHRTEVRNCAPEDLEVPQCAIAHWVRASRIPE